jgi:hypothetical protein
MAAVKVIFLQIAIKGAKEAYVIYLSSYRLLLLLVVYFLPFEIAAKK